MRLAQVKRQREHKARYESILHMQSLDRRTEDSLLLVVFSCFVKQGLTGRSSQNVKNKQTKHKHQKNAKWTKLTELTRKRRKKKTSSVCTQPSSYKGRQRSNLLCPYLFVFFSFYMTARSVCEHTSWGSCRTQVHNAIEKSSTSGHTFLLQRNWCWTDTNILNICGRSNLLILLF